MRKVLYILHQIFYYLFLFFICCTVVSLPFDKIFSHIPLGLACIAAFMSALTAFSFKKIFNTPVYILFISMFLIYLYAFFISKDKQDAQTDLVQKLSLILIPFIFGINKIPGEKFHTLVKNLFVAACLVFVSISLLRAVYFFPAAGTKYFFYKQLVSFVNIHPSYIGMYLNLVIVFLTLCLFEQEHLFFIRSKKILLILILVFFFYILLLTAKTAFIFALLFLASAYFYYGIKNKQPVKTFLIFFLSVAVMLILILSFNSTRTRFTMLFYYKSVGYDNSVNSRDEIWRAGMQLATDNLIKGVGSGDAEDELVKYYSAGGFSKGVAEKYNAHNQFLQIVIETGIFGLLYYVFILCCMGSIALRHKNYLYLFFILLFIVNSLTESLLETQSGIVFFALFNTFFYNRLQAG